MIGTGSTGTGSTGGAVDRQLSRPALAQPALARPGSNSNGGGENQHLERSFLSSIFISSISAAPRISTPMLPLTKRPIRYHARGEAVSSNARRASRCRRCFLPTANLPAYFGGGCGERRAPLQPFVARRGQHVE